VQKLILFFAATLPLYFDLAVPEVSGDIRWMATSFFAGLCALLLLIGVYPRISKTETLTLQGPLMFWVAGGLAVWAAISMLDALNPLRGIILIKALYAQLLLLVCVAVVAKPIGHHGRFARALLWALAAPLAITAFIGILQFHQFNQASFDTALSGTLWVVLKPLFSVLGWLTQILFGWWVPGWPQTYSLVDQLTSFFLQSAVPGGSFANKNLAGSYTAMMIPLMLYLVISAQRWWEKGLASALLAIALLFLVYARARASWIALLAALLLGGVMVLAVPALRQYVWAHCKPKILAWLLVPAAVLFQHSGDISPVKGSYAIDRTPAEQLAALGSASGGWNEYGGRLAYNLNSLMITKDHWFNGVGLGNFFGIYPAYYNALVTTPTNSYNVMARPQRTHTDVMQAFTEMGIPGGVLYVGLFALGIAMGFRLLGAHAGRLGGALVGAGLLSALLLLTLFLGHKGMVKLPGMWHPLFALLLASGVTWFMWRAIKNIIALNTKAKPQPLAQALEEWQVAGFFGTIGLLCICLNAFLDFPMQLPTAPAAAAMLIGLITALHGALYPKAWQLKLTRSFKILNKIPSKKALGVGIVILALVWVAALYDAYKFRQGNTLLKVGMIRIFSGVVDDTTWQIMHAANTVYPLDPRIHENLGVVYANYNGSMPVSLNERIAGLEWVAAGDAWGANHLVNLAGLYIQSINTYRMAGDEATAQTYLVKLNDVSRRLMRVADFSHMSWGVMGIYKLLNNQPNEAIPLLQRSLTIEPTYPPAITALQTAVSLTGVAPMVVQDAILQRAQ
jgi:hypothetical protein